MSGGSKRLIYALFLLPLLWCSIAAHAQQQQQQQPSPQQLPPQLQPPHPPVKAVQRYEIDAKRMGVGLMSDDALPRSREFKRIDSTYYVGWMYEGSYKYDHAADYLGYKNASVPLERALGLLERDYKRALSTRTDNLLTYFPMYKFQIDYTQIAYFLMNCYSNTDQPDKVFALLKRVLKWNFQREYYLDAYDYMAWTVHRNRFYTNSKYSFLKNSINDNEKLANYYLDQQLKKIDRDKITNAHIFPPEYDKMDRLGVYHYKAMLYGYNLKIDSAMFYYELMRGTPVFSHNNYATLRSICGDFRTAEKEYTVESRQPAGTDKRLQEWAYYSTIIDIYKAAPKDGADLAKAMIMSAGSTPGYGWYNIALARCMLYDGQVSEADRYINKAAEFKETHIGTTLGQTHYDFSIQLIKLINKTQQWQMQKFENRNWWYNPKVLYNMSELLGEKFLQQFLIINQFSQNPERDRVIYKLFSTESTVSWDEIWYLIRDFSTEFFLGKFQKAADTDDRRYVHKYFQLFVAMLHMKQGDYTKAKDILDSILKDPTIDKDYERLFLARVIQAEAECAKEKKDMTACNDYLYRLNLLYPQLIPYTDLTPNVSLHVTGSADKDVVDRLKACNINWVTNSSIPFVDAYVNFSGKKKITYYVTDRSGNAVVKTQSFVYQKPEDAGISLAYRIFNVGSRDTVKVNN
jgi:hypothetical protein